MPTSATAKKDRKDKVASPQRAVNDNAAWKTDRKRNRVGGEIQVSTATARPANDAEQQAKPAERKVFAPAPQRAHFQNPHHRLQ
jgi:hypothetical protein